MKKDLQKNQKRGTLKLSKETVRLLEVPELRNVVAAGAVSNSGGFTNIWCCHVN